jgi:hypothetical protein
MKHFYYDRVPNGAFANYHFPMTAHIEAISIDADWWPLDKLISLTKSGGMYREEKSYRILTIPTPLFLFDNAEHRQTVLDHWTNRDGYYLIPYRGKEIKLPTNSSGTKFVIDVCFGIAYCSEPIFDSDEIVASSIKESWYEHLVD